MPQAARLHDPIGHSPSMSLLLKGLLIGAAIGIAAVAIIGTGGLAAVAVVGGLAAGGASVPKAFEANPGMGNLGRGFEVTTPGGAITPITKPMPNVNLVLIPDGKGGYLIHTAHPF